MHALQQLAHLRTISNPGNRVGRAPGNLMALIVVSAALGGCNLDSSLSDARLATLVPSVGVLVPAFDPDVREYRVDLGLAAQDFSIVSTPLGGATIEVDGVKTDPGDASPPRTLALGPNTIAVVGFDGAATATYTIVADRAAGVVQREYLKASNTGPQDNFGFSVAMSGDTLVVGAIGESSSATGVDGPQANDDLVASGAAYVFVRTGAEWTQQAYLKASNAGEADAFGFAVAISGNTIAVGAPFEDSSTTGINNLSDELASNAGAVYVFTRIGAEWAQEAYVKPSTMDSGDGFGHSVALSGPGGLGDTLVVGAPGEDSNAILVDGIEADNSLLDSGAAFVFVRRAGIGWEQQAYLKASNTGANDQFAGGTTNSLAIDRDTIVVGAFGEASSDTGPNGVETDDSAPGSGAAYVYVRNGQTWTFDTYLKASNTTAEDAFGTAVAIAGTTIAVGAQGEDGGVGGIGGDERDDSESGAGAVFLFERLNNEWTQQAYVKAEVPRAGDVFGRALALAVDILVVGAPNEDTDAGNSGAAYVFTRSDVWRPSRTLKASNSGAEYKFGFDVTMSGDTVVIGSNNESSGATGVGGDPSDTSAAAAGAAYVFQ